MSQAPGWRLWLSNFIATLQCYNVTLSIRLWHLWLSKVAANNATMLGHQSGHSVARGAHLSIGMHFCFTDSCHVQAHALIDALPKGHVASCHKLPATWTGLKHQEVCQLPISICHSPIISICRFSFKSLSPQSTVYLRPQILSSYYLKILRLI